MERLWWKMRLFFAAKAERLTWDDAWAYAKMSEMEEYRESGFTPSEAMREELDYA